MIGEAEWFGRGGDRGREVIGKEEWLGRKSGSRKSGWGGRVVREEEWLGKRSGSGGGVVGEEE